MKKIDLLIQRYKDFLTATDALLFVDEDITTGHFDAVSNRNNLQIGVQLLVEVAAEIGAEIEVLPRDSTKYGTEYRICYEGITLYALGGVNATP